MGTLCFHPEAASLPHEGSGWAHSAHPHPMTWETAGESLGCNGGHSAFPVVDFVPRSAESGCCSRLATLPWPGAMQGGRCCGPRSSPLACRAFAPGVYILESM